MTIFRGTLHTKYGKYFYGFALGAVGLEPKNLKQVLHLGLRNKHFSDYKSIRKNKLASSKIFDLEVASYSQQWGASGKKYTKLPISYLNLYISNRLDLVFFGESGTRKNKSRRLEKLEDLSKGNWISANSYFGEDKTAKRKYNIYSREFSVEFIISTGSLSVEDLDQILKLGLELERYVK